MKRVLVLLVLVITLASCTYQHEKMNITNPDVTLIESDFIKDTTAMHGYYKTSCDKSVKSIYYYDNERKFMGKDEVHIYYIQESDIIIGILIGVFIELIAAVIAIITS
jgi:hypothetical protein